MDNKDKNKSSSVSLNDEDQEIWDSFAKEIAPQDQDDELENFKELLDEVEPHEDSVSKTSKVKIERHEKSATRPKDNQEPQIDRRTAARLKKGQIQIEARLDLHGFNKLQAYDATINFIEKSYKRGFRNVIIITGKGKSKSTSEDWIKKGEGVLKQNVPLWLREDRLKPYILKIETAHPKDGGEGALYVYLRKNKN